MKISIDELGMISHTGDNPEMAYNRGLLYLSYNEFEDAINDFTDAIKLKPEFHDAYEKRAYCYYRLNHFQNALQDYLEVYKIKQDDINLITQIMDVYRLMRNHEYVVYMSNAGIKIDPLNSTLYFHRGLSFFENNQIELALTDFFTSHTLDANEDRPIYYIGACLMHLDRKKEAHSFFSKYIKDYSNCSLLNFAYYQRAIVNNQLGDFQSFKDDLINSAKLGLKEAIQLKNEFKLEETTDKLQDFDNLGFNSTFITDWRENIFQELKNSGVVMSDFYFSEMNKNNKDLLEHIVLMSETYNLLNNKGLLNKGYCPITGEKIGTSYSYNMYGRHIYLSKTGLEICKGVNRDDWNADNESNISYDEFEKLKKNNREKSRMQASTVVFILAILSILISWNVVSPTGFFSFLGFVVVGFIVFFILGWLFNFLWDMFN